MRSWLASISQCHGFNALEVRVAGVCDLAQSYLAYFSFIDFFSLFTVNFNTAMWVVPRIHKDRALGTRLYRLQTPLCNSPQIS